METEVIFKRRRNHNNTPKSLLLIITNYVVCCTLFTITTKPGWFFWIALALLALYNYYAIRRNREEYHKINVIAYAISLLGILLLYVLAHKGL